MEALQTTGILAVFGGLAVMMFSLIVVFVGRHGNPRVTGYISRSTWLPFSMPGPAMALGILWVLLSVPLLHRLYGSFAAMFIGLVIIAVPIAMRNLEPAVMQVSRDLEEAAWISGSAKVLGFFDVVARLVIPSFLSGWLLVGILISGNLVMPLMVGSPLLNTVPRMIYDFYGTGQGPAAAAMACIYLLGVVVIFLLGLVAKFLLLKLIARLSHTSVEALDPSPELDVSATAALIVPDRDVARKFARKTKKENSDA